MRFSKEYIAHSADCALAMIDELAALPFIKVTNELRQRGIDAISGLVVIVGMDEKRLIELYKAWKKQEPKRNTQPPST